MVWLLMGYMWLFIHRPFEVWQWLGDLHIERIYVVFITIYWAFLVRKRWIGNKFNVALLAMAVVILTSTYLSPYTVGLNSTVEDWLKVTLFYIFVISSVREERDLKRLAVAFLASLALYMSHSLLEYHNGRHMYRMATARMIGVDRTFSHPNSFGSTILYGLTMVIPAWVVFRKVWQHFALIGYIALSVVCIALTGSRSTYVGLLALAFMVALFSKHRIKVTLLFLISAPILWIGLRTDLQNRLMTLIDPSYGTAGALASAESRLRGLLDGIMLWKANPVLGVGPGVFGQVTGTGIQSHNLYGQVLGEVGTLGAIAFLAMVSSLLWNARESRKIWRGLGGEEAGFSYYVCVATAVTVALLLLMGWGGHNLYRYTWIWMGAFQAVALHWLRQKQLAGDPAYHTEILQSVEDPDGHPASEVIEAPIHRAIAGIDEEQL